MENHHSGKKSKTNLNPTSPASNIVPFYSATGDRYSATESGMQTMANALSQSIKLSNSLYEAEMEQSKSVSTCSNVAQPNAGSFVESVDSSGTTVTSSCVPVENRAGPTYLHQHSPSQSTTVQNTETFKWKESATSGPSPYWALIEWETTNEEPSSYTVIESSQIVEVSREKGRSDEERDSTLYTGKLIHVLRGRYIMPATIVIISEDKKFLETELHELRMMAANNLIAKSAPQSQPYRKQAIPKLKHYGRVYPCGAMQSQQNTVPTSPEIVNSSKRQRCDSGSSSSMKEIESRVSSASVQNVVKEEARHAFKADISYQKTLPPVRPMEVRVNRNVPTPVQAPPMTFDQQTQTTGPSSDVTASYDANFVRILSYLESVMAEQKGYRMESEYNRRLLHELQEKICEQHEMLRNVQQHVAGIRQPDPSKASTESETEQSSSSELLITEIVGNYSPEPGVGTVEDHFVLSSETDTDQQWETQQNPAAEKQQASTGNQIWTPSSNIIVPNEDLASETSITPHAMDKSPKVLKDPSVLEVENQDETVGIRTDPLARPNSATTVRELINNDWVDSMQENESNNNEKEMVPTTQNTRMVAIGNNKTMVSHNVLNNIKWMNYKYATRKVLLAVFPREVLATHSLSGRPCPAHSSFPAKPVKGRLDPKVVADVIQLIRSKFDVDESHVRAVITTKCADENKMLRMRMEKPGKKTTRKSRNKENVSSQINTVKDDKVCLK